MKWIADFFLRISGSNEGRGYSARHSDGLHAGSLFTSATPWLNEPSPSLIGNQCWDSTYFCKGSFLRTPLMTLSEITESHFLSPFLADIAYLFLHPDKRAESGLPRVHIQVHLVAPHLEALLDPQRVQRERAKVADTLVFAGGQEALNGGFNLFMFYSWHNPK